MKALVEVIAKALVDFPDEVAVESKEEEDYTLVQLHVAGTDMGKVIGKQGRTAKAIKTLVKASLGKEDKKVIIEIQ
ncbi:UPF0109 protein [Clostridia bacterium]|nr:UPF0109 protein [Clostridia bacterium]